MKYNSSSYKNFKLKSNQVKFKILLNIGTKESFTKLNLVFFSIKIKKKLDIRLKLKLLEFETSAIKFHYVYQ